MYQTVFAKDPMNAAAGVYTLNFIVRAQAKSIVRRFCSLEEVEMRGILSRFATIYHSNRPNGTDGNLNRRSLGGNQTQKHS
jgi:hypothetical protein